ncbi:reverse transcriptase domain-containing protein [Enterococcus hulanensis]|uniref:reverse transcriptase domain-containing protein n=1 Tax=Enterococcus hulanensis TaxID=2559929 RepID=UPI0010F7222F|nr:reverse transcriptase domain-containing protein [Enterococcus hulanensis]
MRNPEVILNNLAKKTKQKDYKFERIYRNLYNPEFYIMAYGNIASKSGNLTPGVSSETIDGFNLTKIEKLIESLKSENYQPKPVKRIYIPKKNGKKRPLGIPTFIDKLLQEVIRMVLEAIYEGEFSSSSHGFRPNRSCHTALGDISNTFNGSKWFIEGDISSFFDNIDHHILIQLLSKKINDHRFLRLLWKFLRAGYLEDWKFNKTYSGTPQGGIISPILSNIYLNELDKYMEEYKASFELGKKRRKDESYKRLESKMYWLRKKLKNEQLTNTEKQVIIDQLKAMHDQLIQLPYSDSFDESYRRIKYVRYADDFIIGLIGSKKDAETIKSDIQRFLKEKLKIELSMEKTLITHSGKFAKFLGYHVVVSRDKAVKRDKNGIKKRYYSYKCKLYIPKETWINKLKELGTITIRQDGSWMPKHRATLIYLSDIEILSTYNAEIRGIYNYFCLASNTNVLNSFMYVMRYSLFKTLAAKYQSSIAKILRKYKQNGEFMIPYETRQGTNYRLLYNEGFPKKKTVNRSSKIDSFPDTIIYKSRTELTQRLTANRCEWCKETEGRMEVHHVRKLKNLKGKKQWEQVMIARRRKTLILCHNCHVKLHAGKLD